MPTTPRSLPACHRDDASTLVERAKRFSVHVPAVRRISVPPADQLAFYGALRILAAVNVIDWPVASAIGVGEAVVAGHINHRPVAPTEGTTRSASEVDPLGQNRLSAERLGACTQDDSAGRRPNKVTSAAA